MGKLGILKQLMHTHIQAVRLIVFPGSARNFSTTFANKNIATIPDTRHHRRRRFRFAIETILLARVIVVERYA